MTIPMAGGQPSAIIGWHRLTNVDSERRIADCSVCGPNTSVGTRAPNNFRCIFRKRMSDRRSKRPYASHKGDACEWCGFDQGIPEQFDVDHKNERHDDNRLENLQTLCARCHRLKSWLVRQQIPETEWQELRGRYGATVTEVIIDVSKRSG